MRKKLTCLALLGAALLSAENHPETPTLTVQGEAVLQKAADEISMTVGVVTEGANAEKTLQENNGKMQTIIEKLESIGLTSQEYKTGRFTIHPLYTQTPKDPPPYWRATIYGYEVSNTINVTTAKLTLSGEIIDAATKAGANTIENIQFGLTDPRIHRAEAIGKAASNAIEDARSLSRAADVRLNRIFSVSLDGAEAIRPRPQGYLLKSMGGEMTPLEPGNVEVKARVTLVYEVQND